MLFERSIDDDEEYDPVLHESALPSYLTDLFAALRDTLRPHLPSETWEAVFDQPLARQVILNLYPPGQGISPHIDLPHRYADGILGVSLCGGCTMTLHHAQRGETHYVYLPPLSMYVLSGEARWEWSHGIASRLEDVVMNGQGTVTMLRDTRVSVTFRWMKQGADVLSLEAS